MLANTLRPDPYYVRALRDQMADHWGKHHLWKHGSQIAELCGYRMLSAFYDSGFPDIEDRRELLYHYLAAAGFSTENEDDVLRMCRTTLPVDSFLTKVVNALATLYNDPPERVWRTGDAEDSTATALLRSLYKQMGMDGRLQVAYRYSKASSGGFVRPYVGARGRMQLEYTPLHLTRWTTSADYPDELTSIYIPRVRFTGMDGKPLREVERVFEVWEADRFHYETADGKETWWMGANGEPLTEAELVNPYERIPYVVMRLVEPNDNSTFTGGLMPLAEANLRRNMASWLGDSSAKFESWGHWVGINLEMEGRRPKMGFGRGTFLENVDSEGPGGKAAPNLMNVSTNGQYTTIGQFARGQSEDAQRDAGLPESLIKEGMSPLSGIARVVERLGLIEARETDAQLLAPFEQMLSDMVAVVYNADVYGKVAGATRMPEPGRHELAVTFAEERVYLEPAVQFEMLTKQFEAGIIGPARFVRDAVGRAFDSDEDAAQFIIENRALGEGIKTGKLPSKTSVPGADVAAASGPSLLDTVGGAAQVADRQKDFYSGQLPREAVRANLVRVSKVSPEIADELLPLVLPTPLAQIAESEAVDAEPQSDLPQSDAPPTADPTDEDTDK